MPVCLSRGKQRYYHKVRGEANRIRRFLTEDRLMRTANSRSGVEVRSVAADVKLKEKRGHSAVKENSVPSRAVLSALAKQALQNTKAFLLK